MKLLLIICLFVSKVLAFDEADFIARINEKAKGIWTAGPSGLGGRKMKPLLGLLKDTAPKIFRSNHKFPKGLRSPDSFDSRTNWPQCKSISMIWDQASCGSCWAVAAAGAMSDRLCIHNNNHNLVSPYNLLTCCGKLCGSGCNGGFNIDAWKYWTRFGISTGGPYNDTDSCQPYNLPPCSHHVDGRYPQCGNLTSTPTCEETCVNGNDYTSDKTFGKEAYYVSFWNSEEMIKSEIMTYGPVEAGMDVFEDFEYYQSGVYHNVHGRYLGGHSVRIIGWGEENNTPYWLVANSWNEDWGDKGLFKIKRGNDECGIEEDVVAGMPK